MTRVGAIYSPYQNAPEAFRPAVRAAEAAGLPELWLWEDCFRTSAFASAAAALAWTERLRIGIGIAPMPLRNVAATAMEIATIERLTPGRLLPGVGHGVQSWMAQIGARVASPLTLLREYAPALRALLAGEEVTVAGRYVTLEGVRLDWPPASAPHIYAAAEGPKTLALSGEVADGTVLDSRRTPTEFGMQVSTIRAARAAAGRPEEHDIVAYAVAAFGAGAEDRARADAGPRGAEDDRVLWGGVEDVAAGVARIAAAGVDAVILLPAAGEPDLAAFYAHAGEVARRVDAD
jgi:alkanesulfonate monooxygenase SsuD/methylene tetrahydromethanopterin reductase-like flavin-dependent oxidoreductase (luciferase family)